MKGLMFAFVLVVVASGHDIFIAPGGPQRPLALAPSVVFGCSVLVTTRNVFVIDSNLSVVSQTNIYNLLSFARREPTCATFFLPADKGSARAYVGIGDNLGGISFASFGGCNDTLLFEESLSYQLDAQEELLVVRITDSSDRQFVALSQLVTVGWAQGVHGLQPAVRSVQTFATPLSSYLGAAETVDKNLVILESSNSSSTCQRLVDAKGSLTSEFCSSFSSATSLTGLTSPNWAQWMMGTFLKFNQSFAGCVVGIVDDFRPNSVADVICLKTKGLAPSSANSPWFKTVDDKTFGFVLFGVPWGDDTFFVKESVALAQIEIRKDAFTSSFELTGVWAFNLSNSQQWQLPSRPVLVEDPSASDSYAFAILEEFDDSGTAIVRFNLLHPQSNNFEQLDVKSTSSCSIEVGGECFCAINASFVSGQFEVMMGCRQ